MPVVVELWESLRSWPPKEVMVALVSKDILSVAAAGAAVAEVDMEVDVDVVKEVKCWASCWRRLR